MLREVIGDPAMLEQTAEECVEMAQAALKLARFFRNENKVWGKNRKELFDELYEEVADVKICIEEITDGGEDALLDPDYILRWVEYKRARMTLRLNSCEEPDYERIIKEGEKSSDKSKNMSESVSINKNAPVVHCGNYYSNCYDTGCWSDYFGNGGTWEDDDAGKEIERYE